MQQPTLAALGKSEKLEHEYIRHGTRCLIASLIVPTGEVVCDLGVTRTNLDFAAHLNHVAVQLPDHKRFHWVLIAPCGSRLTLIRPGPESE